MDERQNDDAELARLVERASKLDHVTLMKFTTGWKAMLGTPELTLGPDPHDPIGGGGYGAVRALQTYTCLKHALRRPPAQLKNVFELGGCRVRALQGGRHE